jgi:hypothetical protein
VSQQAATRLAQPNFVEADSETGFVGFDRKAKRSPLAKAKSTLRKQPSTASMKRLSRNPRQNLSSALDEFRST